MRSSLCLALAVAASRGFFQAPVAPPVGWGAPAVSAAPGRPVSALSALPLADEPAGAARASGFALGMPPQAYQAGDMAPRVNVVPDSPSSGLLVGAVAMFAIAGYAIGHGSAPAAPPAALAARRVAARRVDAPRMIDTETLVGGGVLLASVGGGVGLIAFTENQGKRNEERTQ